MRTLEVRIPDHWTPELTLATSQLVSRAVSAGFPIVTSVRATATPEQIRGVYNRIQEMLDETGLAA